MSYICWTEKTFPKTRVWVREKNSGDSYAPIVWVEGDRCGIEYKETIGCRLLTTLFTAYEQWDCENLKAKPCGILEALVSKPVLDYDKTKSKIEIMQAYCQGKKIEYKDYTFGADWQEHSGISNDFIDWDWKHYTYRIKPDVQEIKQNDDKVLVPWTSKDIPFRMGDKIVLRDKSDARCVYVNRNGGVGIFAYSRTESLIRIPYDALAENYTWKFDHQAESEFKPCGNVISKSNKMPETLPERVNKRSFFYSGGNGPND